MSDQAELRKLRNDIKSDEYARGMRGPNDSSDGKKIEALEDKMADSRCTNATMGIIYEILFLVAALGLLTGAAMLALKGDRGEQIAGGAIIMVLIVSLYIFGGSWIASLVKNIGSASTSM